MINNHKFTLLSLSKVILRTYLCSKSKMVVVSFQNLVKLWIEMLDSFQKVHHNFHLRIFNKRKVPITTIPTPLFKTLKRITFRLISEAVISSTIRSIYSPFISQRWTLSNKWTCRRWATFFVELGSIFLQINLFSKRRISQLTTLFLEKTYCIKVVTSQILIKLYFKTIPYFQQVEVEFNQFTIRFEMHTLISL